MKSLGLGSMNISRQDRPWLVVAIFLLFVLLSLCERKYGASSTSAETFTKQSNPIQAPSFTSDIIPETVDYSKLPVPPPSTFHFCTKPHITLRATNRTVGIPYQCDGPLYRSFVGHLRAFIGDLVAGGDQSTNWGHRKALPPNRRYLFLGNSHTRQSANAMLCQLNVLHSEALDPTNAAMARRYDLENGAQVYLVVNSYAVHSPRWVEILAKQIGVPLADFDAVVLGVFNTCNAPVNTTFAAEMKALGNNESGVDCINRDGPSFVEVAAAYPGPLAYMSMYATYRYSTYSKDRDDLLEMHKTRSNLLYLDGRQYVRDMMEECGSAKRDELTDCIHDDQARRYLHRCVGQFGGHPDLLAWEAIEFFYQYASGGV